MAEKRKRDPSDEDDNHHKRTKKTKKGFNVGPANLPEGAYKKRNQKIKASLIERAQIKKNYAKLKRQGKIPAEQQQADLPQPASLQNNDPPPENDAEADTAPHPDRQTLIDREASSPQPPPPPPAQNAKAPTPTQHRQKKAKSLPFKREHEQAQQRKAEAEERQRAREEAERQRATKMEERERHRRSMQKARRVGPDGKRKLGRESKPLLERVKRLVGEGG